MRHTNYKLKIQKIAEMHNMPKAIRKGHSQKVMDTIKSTCLPVMLEHLDQASVEAEMLDFYIEQNWLENEKNSYFFDTVQVFDGISRSTASFKYSAGIFKPETFIINFPYGSTFDGEKLVSAMVTITNPKAKAGDDLNSAPLAQHSLKTAITVRLNSPLDGMLIRSTQHLQEAEATLNSKKYKQLGIPIIGGGLSNNEECLLLATMKTVFKFLLFKQTLPDRIEDRFPNHHITRGMKNTNPRPKVITSPISDDSATAHYRSWHFRQLRDARFYRGKHSNKLVGSRIVFISDSYVNGEISPHTAIK